MPLNTRRNIRLVPGFFCCTTRYGDRPPTLFIVEAQPTSHATMLVQRTSSSEIAIHRSSCAALTELTLTGKADTGGPVSLAVEQRHCRASCLPALSGR